MNKSLQSGIVINTPNAETAPDLTLNLTAFESSMLNQAIKTAIRDCDTRKRRNLHEGYAGLAENNRKIADGYEKIANKLFHARIKSAHI